MNDRPSPTKFRLIQYAAVDWRHLELLGNVRRMDEPVRAAFLRELIVDSRRVTNEELALLLGPMTGWRERLVAAWLAGIDGRASHRERFGELLIASKQTYAGAGYCFALACFATPADAEILCEYLDRYLPRLDLVYDQDWAIAALRDIDARLGTEHAARFTVPDGLWEQWARKWRASTADLGNRRPFTAELRSLVERAREAKPPTAATSRTVKLPDEWAPIAPEDSARYIAELAVDIRAEARHMLEGVPLLAVAHCDRRHQLLFEVVEDPVCWALVKLSRASPPGLLSSHSTTWLYASPETAAAGLREHGS